MTDIDSKETVSSENTESDEDDGEGYFLQASDDAYDIKEKIKCANEELFEETSRESNESDFREPKVTFSDAIDFEPYYSSDDEYVRSPCALGSDNEMENEHSIYQTIQEEEINYPEDDSEDAEEHLEVINEEGLSIFQTIEEDLVEEIQEINLEEEIEEMVDKEELDEIAEELSDEIKSDENIIEIIQNDETIDDGDLEISIIRCEEDSPKNSLISPNSNLQKIPINCRLHCLEKKDLDLINKGCDSRNIQTPNELNLKLIQKSCCQKQERPKLPTYNGIKSEYGLTEAQLERKRLKSKRKEFKKREKIIKIREERIQKDVYNEEIFCAWLKEVAERNKNKCKNNYESDMERRAKSANNFKNKKIRPKIAVLKSHCNTIVLYPGITMKTLI